MKPKLLILDVDGVLSKDKMVDANGKTIGKSFNDKNWTAIKEFKALGIPVVFLTGDPFNVGIARNRKIPCYCTVTAGTNIPKEAMYEKIIDDYNVLNSETIFVADDIFDIEVLKRAGWAFCPFDAHPLLRDVPHVRELLSNAGSEIICEMLYLFIEEGVVDQPDIDKVIEIDKTEHGC